MTQKVCICPVCSNQHFDLRNHEIELYQLGAYDATRFNNPHLKNVSYLAGFNNTKNAMAKRAIEMEKKVKPRIQEWNELEALEREPW